MKKLADLTLATRLTARFARAVQSIALLAALTASHIFGQIPGTLDPTFDPGLALSTNYWNYWTVHAVLPLPGGSVVVGGEFTMASGAARDNIICLLSNGSTDSNFVARITQQGGNASVEALVAQGTKLLVGGRFDSVNGMVRRGLARLNGDGTLDTTFNPNLGYSAQVEVVVVQPDNRIIVAGSFMANVGASFRQGLARLNADGSLDLSFDATYAPGGFVYAAALQPDGKLVVGGFFAGSGANCPTNLARLGPNGTLDTNYWPGFDTFGIVYGIAIQADGKAVLAGGFDNVNGVTRYGYARVNLDGTLDASFELKDAGTNLFSSGGRLRSVAVQSDQKILLGGTYAYYGGGSGERVVRFMPDGTADQAFVSLPCSSGTVETARLQSDGKLLVVGRFDAYGGVPRRGVARRFGDAIPQPPRIALSHQSGGAMRLDVTNPASQTLVLQAATNLNAPQWTALATNGLGANRVLFLDTNAWKYTRRFYRTLQISP
jgi:uncharacterized delta-60 repeat protein